jgi:lysylphosphatidylglycerol synthetase-like protein (DUF2156 family)
VQFAGPFAGGGDYVELLRRFDDFAVGGGCNVVAIQLQRHDAQRYADYGYTVNQIGASYALSLADFSLRGSKYMQLRNKVSRARRAGLTVAEVAYDEWQDRMAQLDASWLRSKGRHAKPLEFLVGQLGGDFQPSRRLFIGLLDGRLAGYISFSPVTGQRPGWLHDLSRRDPGGPPGVMEAINHTAIGQFQTERVAWLHFGFTPFTGLDPELEVETASRPFGWLVRQLRARGSAVYPAATQLAYKQKWGCNLVIPEYIAFSGRASLAGFLHVFKVSNAL